MKSFPRLLGGRLVQRRHLCLRVAYVLRVSLYLRLCHWIVSACCRRRLGFAVCSCHAPLFLHGASCSVAVEILGVVSGLGRKAESDGVRHVIFRS